MNKWTVNGHYHLKLIYFENITATTDTNTSKSKYKSFKRPFVVKKKKRKSSSLPSFVFKILFLFYTPFTSIYWWTAPHACICRFEMLWCWIYFPSGFFWCFFLSFDFCSNVIQLISDWVNISTAWWNLKIKKCFNKKSEI